ncbi:MAG: 2-hydroxyglutaryl-CoA dehydratase [Candidatus Heimdallarchaeota archaeon]|nr:2-hydroxyglutaryl-CoA dehydratase [Candidatus Heimdallarchaeota archaeon]
MVVKSTETEYFLGIDIGSITGKVAIIDEKHRLIDADYRRTDGKPIEAIKKGLAQIQKRQGDLPISGAATTGSGRKLLQTVIGADVAKDEINAHAAAAVNFCPDVQTVIDIGGQDSKLIIIRDGWPVDFAMNSICAAGTGSFLDKLGDQLGVSIEEFGPCAICSENPSIISGRCTVFAESDIISKKNLGHKREDILMGLCNRLAENYRTNLARGKDIRPPILFQGGVAKNEGIVEALEKVFAKDLNGSKIIIPKHHGVMGAIGAAILAHEEMQIRAYHQKNTESSFYGWTIPKLDYSTRSFYCHGCENLCEIIEVRQGKKILGRWGGKCDKWE